MEKQSFIKMIETAENFNAEIERWNDFGIEIFELPICEYAWKMFDYWLEENFTVDGRDWITWYLWDRISIISGEVLPCYDENDNEFYVNNPEDLWDLVEKYQIDYEDTKSNIN